MRSNIINYIQAGLDESLAQFVKGVFASIIVAAVMYTYHHVTKQTLNTVTGVSAMGLGTPALLNIWKWALTTSSSSVSTSTTPTTTTSTLV